METNQPTEPDKTPQNVIHLATQMVCAQMIAESQFNLTVQLAQRFDRTVANLVRRLTARSENGTVILGTNDTRELYELAYSIRRPLSLSPMSHRDLDRYFQSAIYRASRLLESPEMDTRTVYAEQLFEPEEILSENQIFKRFYEHRWPKLTGRESVRSLFKKLHQWFYAHHVQLQSVDQSGAKTDFVESGDANANGDPTPYIKRLVCELQDMLTKSLKNGTIPPEVEKQTAINASLSKFLAFYNLSPDPLLQMIRSSHQSNLVEMFFCDTPIERQGSDEVENGKAKTQKSPERNYHPWGLFRYLRGYGKESRDTTGRELNANLHCERRELHPGKAINIDGIYPSEYAFGPIGKALQDLLDSEEQDENIEPDDPDYNRAH